MNDDKNFNDKKERLISENDKKYGEELRKKYGEDDIKSANEKVRQMNKKRFEYADELLEEIKILLIAETPRGDTSSIGAKKLFELHKKWLSCYYHGFSKEYHLAMATIYVEDERFKKTYDDIYPGGAKFLSDVIIDGYK